MLVKRTRHQILFHLRKQKYWIRGVAIILTVYFFFVWVATRSRVGYEASAVEGVEGVEVDGRAPDGEVEVAEQEKDPGDDSKPFQHGRCAINFFGLPRSFESMVLPSMIKNVIKRNARFGCDYFIHYYHQESENAGRAGKGGQLNPDEVLLMRQPIKQAAKDVKSTPNRNPAVIFIKDTEEEFWQKRGEQVEKYRTTKASDGNYLYYPWKAVTYRYPESIDNIVKQW